MAAPAPVSPLAPTKIPEMPEIAGVRLATAAAGIRYKGRTDVLLAVMDKGTTAAGVFTKSKCPSAPVEWCRAVLKGARKVPKNTLFFIGDNGQLYMRSGPYLESDGRFKFGPG